VHPPTDHFSTAQSIGIFRLEERRTSRLKVYHDELYTIRRPYHDYFRSEFNINNEDSFVCNINHEEA